MFFRSADGGTCQIRLTSGGEFAGLASGQTKSSLCAVPDVRQLRVVVIVSGITGKLPRMEASVRLAEIAADRANRMFGAPRSLAPGRYIDAAREQVDGMSQCGQSFLGEPAGTADCRIVAGGKAEDVDVHGPELFVQ
jgi:hypothetical protein